MQPSFIEYMETYILKGNSPNAIGAMASGLCLVHCIATPFIFIAQSGLAAYSGNVPVWWQCIDYIFIVISFFAVFWSARKSSKDWMKKALWTSWILLSAIILSEKAHFVHLPHILLYFPALALVVLHIHNRKYC